MRKRSSYFYFPFSFAQSGASRHSPRTPSANRHDQARFSLFQMPNGFLEHSITYGSGQMNFKVIIFPG